MSSVLLAACGSAWGSSTVAAHYKMGELESAGGATVGGTATSLLPTTGTVNLSASGTPLLRNDGPPASARGGSTHFMRFDGVVQRYDAGPNLLGSGVTNEWMIEAWVRPQTGGSGLGMIVSHGHGGAGHMLNYDAGANRYGWFVGGVGQFNGSLGATALGTAWDHLALVRTGGVDYLYVNGVLAGQNTAQGTTPYANGSSIGTQYTGGGDHGFTGDIDEVYFSTISSPFNPATDLHMSNPADPVIVLPGAAVSAGTVAVNTNSTLFVDVNNSGASNTLSITAVTPLAGDTGKFALVSPLPFNVAPGETELLEFTYTPGATAADHSANFTITNNDVGHPSPSLTLTGKAISDPNMEVPATLAFGTIASTVSTQKTIRISNTAFSNDLNVSLAIGGADAAKFSIVDPAPPTFSIAPGSFMDVIVASAPGGFLGSLTATLEITHNDPDLGTQSVALSAESVPRFTELAHYRLGESDADLGTTLDDTGDADLTNINGTPGTSYNLGAGVAGSSKGIDQTLHDVYNSPAIPAALVGRTQNWGMEAWIRPELSTGSAQIQGGYGGLYFGVGNGSRGGFSIFSLDGLHWGLNIGGIHASVSPALIRGGIWTHVAAVTVDNQVRLYVNGVLAQTYNGLGYAPNDTQARSSMIELGGQTDNSWRTAGGLDEARLFTFVSGQFNPATDLHVTPPADADGDGLADLWEDQYFGDDNDIVVWTDLSPTDGSADTDGDSFSDKAEHDANTDPKDENSHPSIEPLAITSTTKVGNTVTVGFTGVDGGTYVLKKGLTLSDSFPTTCGTVTLTGTSTGTLQDTSATEPKAFYRVEKQ